MIYIAAFFVPFLCVIVGSWHADMCYKWLSCMSKLSDKLDELEGDD